MRWECIGPSFGWLRRAAASELKSILALTAAIRDHSWNGRRGQLWALLPAMAANGVLNNAGPVDKPREFCPMTRISIVTPSLNQGRYLSEALESVRLQNCP